MIGLLSHPNFIGQYTLPDASDPIPCRPSARRRSVRLNLPEFRSNRHRTSTQSIRAFFGAGTANCTANPVAVFSGTHRFVIQEGVIETA